MTTLVPIDVRPEEFKGVSDGEFVPMDVVEEVVAKGLNKGGKLVACSTKDVVQNIVHGRANKNKALTPITNEMLNATVTLKVRDIVSEYRPARQNLMSALRAMPGDEVSEPEHQGPGRPESNRDDAEKKTPNEKRELNDEQALSGTQKVLTAEYRGRIDEPVTLEELWRIREIKRGAARPISLPQEHKSNLPTVLMTIGRLTVKAIIDMGSMVNVISAKQAARTGIPTGPLAHDAFDLGGIVGPESPAAYTQPI